MNKVIQGDCLEVMKDIPDKSIDMILCDLPYGTTACKWDTIIPFEPLWEQYKRIIKKNGAIVLFGTQPFTSTLGVSNIDELRYSWTWRKSRPSGHLNAKRMPLKDTEDILVFYAKQPTYSPQGIERCSITKKNTEGRLHAQCYGSVVDRDHIQENTNYPRQVLDFSSVHNVGDGIHPTQKPVALFEYLIKTYTNEGDLVLDNCAGSGTTGVAARNLNRNYILIEKEQEYINIINKRLESNK